MTSRTITAIYDSLSAAQRAQSRLHSAGVREDDVRIVNQSTDSRRSDTDEKGMWESIKDFFIPDEDRPTYAEGLRRGGYLLTAQVDDARTDEAISILEDSDAVDLDSRSEQWRSEGWTGAPVGGFGQQTDAYMQREDGARTSQTASRASLDGAQDETDEAIPIVREQLRVGKREVNRGGVRVRSYVVEEPVSEQIDLREEHVEVDRRAVDRRVSGTDAGDLLQERTIEVTEKSEEPVVSKEAEVTEEVAVRKFEGHRTEGVSDTVRHTEVEVEDMRDDQTAAPPPSKGSRRTRQSNSKPSR